MDTAFVYIIESPSQIDLYHKRSEGQLLMDALRLSGISSVSRCAISRVAFDAAFKVGLKEEMEERPGMLPLIHISCHGSNEGLSLSNNDFISWKDLYEILQPVNEALKNRLVVSMSCCEGYSGVQMAMRSDDKPHPYFCLIGTPDKPTWADTSVAFTVFYYRFAKGAHVSEAVEAMRQATGIQSFYVEWADNSKKFYLDYITKHDTSNAADSLTATANAQSPGDLAQQNLLEKGQT